MFDDLDIDAVESELVTIAGRLAAGTCRFLQLVAEFDARNGWAGPGLRSCAHWLNWRVGMSLRTARDHLRVAHTLAALPATTAAFAAGRVSYSKVRALTRIATPATEDGLLNIALHGTTSQLESVVAAARAGVDPRPAAARRSMRWSRAADGSLLVSMRIPAERGEQLVAAVESFLTASTSGAAGSDAAGSDAAAPAAAEADGGSADPPRAEPWSHSEEDPAGRHREWRAAEAEQLARGLERAPGAATEPVAARRLDALLDLVTGTTLTHPTMLVVHVRTDDPAPTDPAPTDPAPTNSVSDVASPRPRAWIDGGPAILLLTAARMTCTAAVRALLVDRRGNPLHLGRTRRTASPRQLLALRVRDGNTCTFPGCTTTRHLDAHHLRWWQWGGPTDLDNLALLCGFHHTLIHEHGYRAARATDGLAFHRPDGTPIPAAGPPLDRTADALVADHTRALIDNRTITPQWGGERLDVDAALAWLLPELAAPVAAA